MSIMKTRPTATMDDLLNTPEDGRKYELVDGEILVTPAGMRHSEIGVRISYLLTEIADRTGAGKVYSADVGIILPNGNVRSPDVCFVRQEKLPDGKSPESFGEVIPDLAVEVLSPIDSMRQVADKIGEFLEFGVPIVWLVDPKSETVTVYRSLSDTEQLSKDDVINANPVLPEFSARVSQFFP